MVPPSRMQWEESTVRILDQEHEWGSLLKGIQVPTIAVRHKDVDLKQTEKACRDSSSSSMRLKLAWICKDHRLIPSLIQLRLIISCNKSWRRQPNQLFPSKTGLNWYKIKRTVHSLIQLFKVWIEDTPPEPERNCKYFIWQTFAKIFIHLLLNSMN